MEGVRIGIVIRQTLLLVASLRVWMILINDDLHHSTLFLTYFPLHVQDICFPRCFVVTMCRGSVMFMVPLFSFYAAANSPLAKKTQELMLTFATSWWNETSIQVKHCVDGHIRSVKGRWKYYYLG